jgi:hypothetical protein
MPCRLPWFRIVKTQPIFRVPHSFYGESYDMAIQCGANGFRCIKFPWTWPPSAGQLLREKHVLWKHGICQVILGGNLTADCMLIVWHICSAILHPRPVCSLSLSLLLSILFCTCAVQPLCDLYNVWTAYQLIFDTRSNQQRNQHIGIACSSPFTWKAQGLETSQTSVKEENNSTHSKTPEAFLSRQCDKRKRLHSSLPLKSWSLLGRSTGPISAVTRISEHWALSAHVCAGQSLRINPQIQQTR